MSHFSRTRLALLSLLAAAAASGTVVGLGVWGHWLMGPVGGWVYSGMAVAFFFLLGSLGNRWGRTGVRGRVLGGLVVLLPLFPILLPQVALPRYYNATNRERIRRAMDYNDQLRQDPRFQTVRVAWKIGWKATIWSGRDRRAPIPRAGEEPPDEEWLEVTGTVATQADLEDLKFRLARTDLGPVHYHVKLNPAGREMPR